MDVTFWQRTSFHFAQVLKTVFREYGLIDLGEEISRQLNIQSVVWVLLDVFSWIYSEDCEKKQRRNTILTEKNLC